MSGTDQQPTSAEGAARRARKLADVFPTIPCGRCGGSGRYSWNAMHGDMCFGCSGSGKAWASKKVAAAVDAYRTAVKSAKQRLAMNLEPGLQVEPGLSYRQDGSGWVEILSVSVTPEVCGWTRDGEPASWYMQVALADGTIHRLAGNTIVRTRSTGVDLAPYLQMAGVAS